MLAEIAYEEFGPKTRIIGASKEWRDLIENIDVVANTDATVLINGESGTGKELVARSIHERSNRADRPFVKVNCAAIAPELFESEFFGHVKGSFTGAVKDRLGRFQAANHGTLFLDEIGEVPLALQGKLLRVLQEGEFERVGEDSTRKVNVRVLAATNRDLQKESEEETFRLDLYYRLNVFPINIAPLRERRGDVEPLAHHFFAQLKKKHRCPAKGLTEENIEVLKRYHYPGNVRELENIIERAMIVSRCGLINFDFTESFENLTFPQRTHKIARYLGDDAPPPAIMTYDELREFEKQNIITALKRTGYKVYGKGGAAEVLGTKPTTLASKIKSMDIPMRPSD